MRSIYEIVEGLDSILFGLEATGQLTKNEINEWNSIMIDYRVWEECNKEE